MRQEALLSASEGDLYLYFLHRCNILYWKNPFNLTTSEVCNDNQIGRATLYRHRNKLKELGLIDFEEGSTNSKPPIYIILQVSKSSSNIPKNSSAALVAPLVDEESEETVKNEVIPQRIHEVRPVFFTYKDLEGTTHIQNIALNNKIDMKLINECWTKFAIDRETDKKQYKEMSDLINHFSNICKKAHVMRKETTTSTKITLGKRN